VMLFPNVADNVVKTAQWIDEFAARDEVSVIRPQFGVPIFLY
jgi:hypothetical protein